MQTAQFRIETRKLKPPLGGGCVVWHRSSHSVWTDLDNLYVYY